MVVVGDRVGPGPVDSASFGCGPRVDACIGITDIGGAPNDHLDTDILLPCLEQQLDLRTAKDAQG